MVIVEKLFEYSRISERLSFGCQILQTCIARQSSTFGLQGKQLERIKQNLWQGRVTAMEIGAIKALYMK